MYSKYKLFVRYMFCMHFLPMRGSSVYFLHDVFWGIEVLNFDKVHFVMFLIMLLVLGLNLPDAKLQRFSPTSCRSFVVFRSRSISASSWFLYDIHGSKLKFLHMHDQDSSTIYLKDYPFLPLHLCWNQSSVCGGSIFLLFILFDLFANFYADTILFWLL